MVEPFLSVVIPAYNEEKRIAGTLKSVFDYLSRQKYFWEVIVVSDGSKDGTAEEVQKFAARHKGFQLIKNLENHGKGYVVRQGMLTAKGERRLFTDADNSTSIEQIENFLPYFEKGYEIVIGSIEIKGAKIVENAQWYRRALGHYSKLLIRVVAGLWSIHDTQRGFKCFTSKAAEDVFSKTKIDRWGFDIEVLALAKRIGYKIKEIPVHWENPGESKVNLKSYFQVLAELFKIRFWLWFNSYKI
ncbi:MAG: dolichyl-phosphate beta-glucosyltransferase [Patescibacteria group bacterium]